MTQLTDRQNKILHLIDSKKHVQNQDIVEFFINQNNTLSRETIARELKELVGLEYIKKIGKGRSVAYIIEESNSLLKFIDHDEYFSKDQDIRSSETIYFKGDIFSKLQGIFSQKEIDIFSKKSEDFKKRVSSLSPIIIQKEFERITVELAWKSSKIEGNTYTLIDTEMLIRENKEAIGHPRGEAIMILNHKKALDYIFNNKTKFKNISNQSIKDIHELLIGDLNVRSGLRSKPVAITGTNYRPLDDNQQIQDAIEKMCEEINAAKDPWTKSLISLLMIAYIQPFEDGNKRTSRLVADACLITEDFCPLSFRNVDVAEYKRAILLFYELGNASLVKKMFIDQYDFVIKNYFL